MVPSTDQPLLTFADYGKRSEFTRERPRKSFCAPSF
jgi:hypothetical protein